MKLLFCTHDIDRGGSARSLMVLLSQLRKRHDIAVVSLVSPEPEKKPAKLYAEWGIPVIVFPWKWLEAGYLNVPFQAPPEILPDELIKNVPKLKKLAATMDCICFNGCPTTRLASILPRFVPKFLILRENIIEKREAAFKFIKGQIGCAVAISPMEAKQLEAMQIPHSVVFNAPFELSDFKGLSDEPIKFATFSQLIQSKGIETLCEAALIAAPELRKTSSAIYLHGGDERTRETEISIRSCIDAEKIGDVLKLSGWCSNVEKEMKNFHCIVRPDNSGLPWGRDIIEAMSSGRPVIATGSIDLFVKPGKTGWLVEPNNPEALAKIIVEAANSPELLGRYAKNAWNFAQDNFNPEINAKKIEAEIIALAEKTKDRKNGIYRSA